MISRKTTRQKAKTGIPEKVRDGTLTHKFLVRCWTEDSEAADEVVVHRHDGARVVELPAIVRCREQRDQLSIRLKLVAVLDDLRVFIEMCECIFSFHRNNKARNQAKKRERGRDGERERGSD